MRHRPGAKTGVIPRARHPRPTPRDRPSPRPRTRDAVGDETVPDAPNGGELIVVRDVETLFRRALLNACVALVGFSLALVTVAA
jgi:hypothetical protein